MYNEALKRRDSLTIWFVPEMALDSAPTGKREREGLPITQFMHQSRCGLKKSSMQSNRSPRPANAGAGIIFPVGTVVNRDSV
jgi:hypothetical protein